MMLQIAGLLMVFTAGIVILLALSKNLSLLELLGLAFPVGFGYRSIQLFMLDLFGLDLRMLSIILIFDAVLMAGLVFLFRGRIMRLKDQFNFKLERKSLRIHLGWLVFFSLTLYVLYALMLKTSYWPVFIYDSIVGGYDRIAQVILAEGTFNNSIFSHVHPATSVRSLYPPLVPHTFFYMLLCGFAHSKMAMFIFTVSAAMLCYGFVVKYTSHFFAMLLTFMLLVTPEYMAFNSLSSNNPPTAYFAGFAMIAMYIWFDTKERQYFNIGVLLMILASWSRSESIVFSVASGLLVLLHSYQTKTWKLIPIYAILCLLPIIVWQLYLGEVLEVTREQPIIKRLYWDSEKFARMIGKMQKVTFSTQYYGLTIYAFLCVVGLNIKFLIQSRDRLALLATIALAWILFAWLYYQIDTDFIAASETGGWIGSGYKRGLFAFLPVIVFYIGCSRLSVVVFKKYLALK